MDQNIVVLDLETQKSFKEVGRSKLDKLRISVAGVYDYLTDKYFALEEKELMALEQRLRNVGFVIGFNIRRFDMPVLAPYLFMPVESIPVLDLLDDIEKARGHRASLESIAVPTLNKHKSGSGADALVLFKENKIEELKRYCLDDVRLTREIYDYGCREGKVLFTSSWDYKTYEIPVTWKEQTAELLQRNTAQQTSFPASLF
jgi:DEAD/DEAH box helicase domain-containing protein